MRNKKITILYLLLILSVILFSSCSRSKVESDPGTVTVGTFNMSWLGDGRNDKIQRTAQDYESIADLLKNSGVDILGVQEIENEDALKLVLKHLTGYSFVLGKEGGPQKIGIIFKNDIKIKEIGEYFPLEVERGRTRPGLVIEAKKGNFDWIMMVVHFKSSSHYEDTKEKREESQELRLKQAEIVSYWADSVLSASNEKDIIITGDFNDTPKRKKNPTLISLLENNNLDFLTAELKSCKFRNLYAIDHIVISHSAENRLIKSSEHVYDTYSMMPTEIAEKISDHCMVLAKFEVKSKDND